MGLDMVPMGKPNPGYEKRWEQIFKYLYRSEPIELSFFDKLKGKKILSREDLLAEWMGNEIACIASLTVPIIGKDKEADEWIKAEYQNTDKEISEEEFINKHTGYYVPQLAKEQEAIPVYNSLGRDVTIFRGQFLNFCTDLIGEELVSEAWNSKMAAEVLDYGNRLMQAADKIAKEHNLTYLKDQRMPPETEEASKESKLHIIYSLAKWLIFYGKKGHGYEADF